MSTNKPNGLDAIKDKVRKSGPTVHTMIIDTITGTSQPEKDIDVNVHVNQDVDVPKRERKPKFEDNYARQTLWVRREFVKQIEEEAMGERGEKTRIVNEALDMYFRKRKRG